jgi:phosphoribosylformylglycinamidine cyclo-ligase
MKALVATHTVLAAAHISGGGLYGNLQRVIPDALTPRFTFDWPVPWIFGRIQELGGIDDKEMRAVFNLGIGVALVAHPGDAAELESAARREDFPLLRIGSLA